MTGHPEVAAALGSWLAGRLGVDEVQVDELHRHAEGWSWQTYTLTASWALPPTGERRRQGLAVRVQPPDGLLAPYDIEGQYRLHRAVLDHSDVPMAQLHWLELDPSVLGMPFYVMERMEGIVPVQWTAKDPSVFPTEEHRTRIGEEFVDILGAIHRIDWQAAELGYLEGPASPEDAPQWAIGTWESYYEDSVLVELPAVRAALAWCRANAMCSGRLTLCHGDFRIGNFMMSADPVDHRHINAVFDWELAHLGDPIEDVAYAGLPLFRGRDPRLSQLLEPEPFFARYEQVTGVRVDPEVFHFWTVLGLVKTVASHVRATRAFEDRRVDDIRLAAMGHQLTYILRQIVDALGLRKAG